MPSHPRVQLLPDDKFWEVYLPRCAVIKDAPQELRTAVYEELKRLDGLLRPALDARWGKTDAYWEVMDDWNACYHHAMSVHSDQMCCGELLDIIQQALAQVPHDWCFHVSLECTEDMGWGLQKAGRGQIFFYRGEIFGNRGERFDYDIFAA